MLGESNRMQPLLGERTGGVWPREELGKGGILTAAFEGLKRRHVEDSPEGRTRWDCLEAVVSPQCARLKGH